MKKIKQSDLSSGKILEALIDRYYDSDTQRNLTAVLNCINDSMFYVPVNIKMKDNDLSLFAKIPKCNSVIITSDMKFTTDILENEQGEKYLPIFTSLTQMPDEYNQKMSIIQEPCGYCFDLAIGMPEIKGVVVNGFTHFLAIEKKLFDVIKAMPSMVE